VGTDISLGLGFGLGASYTFRPAAASTAFEFGLDVFVHHATEESSEESGVFTEHSRETTDLLIFAVRANGLFNYTPRRPSVYFIAGFGFVVASMEWKEELRYTSSDPFVRQLPSKNDADGTVAGNVVNLGVGLTTGSPIEIRLETPMLFFYSVAGNAGSFVPTFTISASYRLN
jgi:hypothetical protein